MQTKKGPIQLVFSEHSGWDEATGTKEHRHRGPPWGMHRVAEHPHTNTRQTLNASGEREEEHFKGHKPHSSWGESPFQRQPTLATEPKDPLGKRRTQSQCSPIDEWIWWCRQTTGAYSAIKNEISAICDTEGPRGYCAKWNKSNTIWFHWDVEPKKTKQMNEQNTNRPIQNGSDGCQRGGGCGGQKNTHKKTQRTLRQPEYLDILLTVLLPHSHKQWLPLFFI